MRASVLFALLLGLVASSLVGGVAASDGIEGSAGYCADQPQGFGTSADASDAATLSCSTSGHHLVNVVVAWEADSSPIVVRVTPQVCAGVDLPVPIELVGAAVQGWDAQRLSVCIRDGHIEFDNCPPFELP